MADSVFNADVELQLSMREGERSEVIYQQGSFDDIHDETQNKISSVEDNNANRVGEVAISSIAIGGFGIVLIVTTALAFLVSFFIPLVITNGGLVVALTVRNEWQNSINHLNNTKDVTKFLKEVNTYEDAQNLFFIVAEFGITFWNYCLGVLYLLFELFVNICVFVFKLVFTNPVKDALLWLVRTLATLAVSLIQELANNFGSAVRNSPNIPEPGLDPGEEFGVYYGTSSVSTSEDNAQKGFIFFNSILAIFSFFSTDAFGEIMNFLVDPVFRNFKDIFKIVANFAAMVGKGGTWTKIFSGDMNRRKIESILASSQCFGSKLASNVQCLGNMAIYEAGEILNSLTFGSGNPFSSFKCSFQSLGTCSADNAVNADTDNIDDEFGAGFCDETECEFFVEDLYNSFYALNNSCAFWVNSPNGIYTCMLMVNDYVNINNTATSKANPSALATEICFVAMAQNLVSCSTYGRPFQFDVPAAATDVCSNTALGADFTACACNFKAPLCNSDCCSSYANHVNLQVLAQIPDRTCAELYTFFPQDKIWCPLIGVNISGTNNPFPDNTYAHMWCAYYNNVLNALCQFAAPFTRIRDLDIPSVYESYVTTACNSTVNQLGVCIPYNTTVDNLAVDVLGFNSDSVTIVDQNDVTPYIPNVPIVTDFGYNDDAAQLYNKNRKKHFCEQYSLIYKNDNLILRSQPWSVFSTASSYCDKEVFSAAQDISLYGTTSFYKYAQPDNTYTPVDMEGLPPGWPAFGDGTNPNLSSPEGTCTAQVGTNLDEQRLQEACVDSLRLDATNTDSNVIDNENNVLGVWKEQAPSAARFDSTTGTIPIDPNDPDYHEKMVERNRTEAVLNLDTDVYDTPYNELPNVTAEWRVNFTNPPADGSLDQFNPGAAFPKFVPDAGRSSRFILSLQSKFEHGGGRPRVPGPDHFGEAKRIVYETFPSFKKAMTKTGRQDTVERAFEYKFKKRMAKVGERIHEKYQSYYEDYRADYGAAGFDPDTDIDHFFHTRQLLMTGDPVADRQINEILNMFANVPHVPVGVTSQQFVTFLENDIINKMVVIAEATMTTVMPSILGAMFEFANIQLNATYPPFKNISFYQNETFGEIQSGPVCGATMQDPYRSCHEVTSSYDCCCPLIGCFPDLPDSIFIARTTEETIDKWFCHDVDNFFGWWMWFVRVILSVIASVLQHAFGINTFNRFILHRLPDNFVACMAVNSVFLFIGIDILFAIYFFFSVQVFTIFILLISNFRKDQAERDAALSQRIDQLRAQIKQTQMSRKRLNDVTGSSYSIRMPIPFSF